MSWVKQNDRTSATHEKSSAGCCTLSSETRIPPFSMFMRVGSSAEDDFGKSIQTGGEPQVRVGLHQLANVLLRDVLCIVAPQGFKYKTRPRSSGPFDEGTCWKPGSYNSSARRVLHDGNTASDSSSGIRHACCAKLQGACST